MSGVAEARMQLEVPRIMHSALAIIIARKIMLGWTLERNFTFIVVVYKHTVKDGCMLKSLSILLIYILANVSGPQRIIFIHVILLNTKLWCVISIIHSSAIMKYIFMMFFCYYSAFMKWERYIRRLNGISLFLACTQLIILNLHEHDNEFKSHGALRCCCGCWWWWFFCARMAWLNQKFTGPKNVIKSCI